MNNFHCLNLYEDLNKDDVVIKTVIANGCSKIV